MIPITNKGVPDNVEITFRQRKRKNRTDTYVIADKKARNWQKLAHREEFEKSTKANTKAMARMRLSKYL